MVPDYTVVFAFEKNLLINYTKYALLVMKEAYQVIMLPEIISLLICS